jgi:27-O-demethylrifamycin SV methyltransferase
LSEPGHHYDRVTEAWRLIFGDELHYGVFDAPDDDLATATGRLTALMVEAAGLGQRPATVLDVGSGTGAIACRLAAEFDVDVLGITTSAVGVAAGRREAQRRGVAARARFEQRDGTDTGLADASFDVVWVLESSHLMRRRDRFVAEIARVARVGGRLCLCDLMLQRDIPFAEVRELRHDLGLLREVFGDAHMERLESYRDRFAEHGIRVDTEIDLTGRTRRTFGHWRANLERNQPAIDDLIGAAASAKFVDATVVLERLWDDGIMGYGLVAGRRAGA